MNKEQLLELLKELFESGEIKIEAYNNKTYVIIDGDWIRVDVQ